MNERSPFFRDAWERHARYETGRKTVHEERIDAYLRAQELADKDAELRNLFREMEECAVRYRQACDRLALARFDKKSSGYIEELDRNRRLAHNACVDSVNIVSRLFRERGVDNEWRRTVGQDRNAVGLWGLEVAGYIHKNLQR